MKKTYLRLGLLSMLFGMIQTSTGQITQTFTYTGDKQTFVVPSCVSQVTITCYGAQGGNGHDSIISVNGKHSQGGVGGLGSTVSGVYPVVAGTVLNLYVGGAAVDTVRGYNGGGAAGYMAGAGGGASDVRLNDTTISSRIIVAGGGGGGGNGANSTNTTSSLNGGNGGGSQGTDGANTIGGSGGIGAVGSTAGLCGPGCSFALGQNGQDGTLGMGGNGGDGESIVISSLFSDLVKTSGGGGGGGYFGGGGGGGGSAGTTICTLNDTGGGGGGAGGTNYINPSFTATATTYASAPAGNGKIVITYTVETPPTASFTINNNSQCLSGNNFEFTNASANATSYLWNFGDGTTATSTSPAHTYTTAGNYDVKLVASSVAGCKDSITSSVNVKQVSASVDTKTACESYTWIDGVTYTASNNTATQTLTNAFGCDSVVTLNLTVITIPVDVTLSGTTITANTSGLDYQWLDCNNNYTPLNGQINQSYTAIANGSYAVKITEGQCADTSDCVNITTVNIAQNERDNFVAVYPNPFINELSIEPNGKSTKFEIYNALGQIVDKGIISAITTIQTTSYKSGIYTLKLEGENGIEFIKLIKQ